MATKAEPTRFQLQYKSWEYVGWTDTKFVHARDFHSLVDMPRFYQTMGISSEQQTDTKPSESYCDSEASAWAVDENAKNGQICSSSHDVKKAINTDAITDGQLLLEFFEFYGYTFDNER